MASRSKKSAALPTPHKPEGSSGGNKAGIPGARPFAKGELDYEDKSPPRRKPR